MNTYKKNNLELLISNQDDDTSNTPPSSERQNTIIKNINNDNDNNIYNDTINQIDQTLNIFNNINTVNNNKNKIINNNNSSFTYKQKITENKKLKERNSYLKNVLNSIENSTLPPQKINGNPYNNFSNSNNLNYNFLLKQNQELLLENKLLKEEYYNNLICSKNNVENLICHKDEIEAKIKSLNYSFNNFLKLLSVNNSQNTPVTKKNSYENENLIFTEGGNLNNNDVCENSSIDDEQIEISLKPFEKKIPPKSANNKIMNSFTKSLECNRINKNDIKSFCINNTLKNSKHNIFPGKKNNLLYSINNNINRAGKVLIDKKNNNLKNNEKIGFRLRQQNNNHFNYNNYKSNGGISKKFSEIIKNK